MNTNTPYILKDLSDNIWNFFLDENSHLVCNNSYENIQIDEGVIEFDVNINYLGIIQLIYITNSGHIKYCQFDKKWNTEILYTLSQGGDKIKDINLYSIDDEIHIFFLFKAENYEASYNLLHYKWHGKNFDTNIVCSINPVSYMLKSYYVELHGEEKYIFFINQEERDIVLNLCEYKKGAWDHPTKLYRLNGDNLNFFTMKENNLFHILNLSREKDSYFLEHVTIDNKGNMTNFKIHESTEKIHNPILIIQNNTLYSMWMECGCLMYCSYNGNWHNINKLPIENTKKIREFRYIYEENSWDNIKAKAVFAQYSLNTKIFLPEKTLCYGDIYKDNGSTLLQNCDADGTIQKLLKELSYNKMLRSNLEKRLSILKNQILNKNVTLNKYNEYINQITVQKRKVENEYNSLLQSQGRYTEELENLKEKLHFEKNKSNNLQKEFEFTFQKQEKTMEDMYTKMKNLELKLQEKEKENNIIKEDLESERSKGFIEKLFKIK